MKRLLAALALSLPVAVAARAAEPPVVLVLNQTREGAQRGTLASLGLKQYEASKNLRKLEQNLRRALDQQDIYGPLLAPTMCPGARVQDTCPAVRAIDDVNLPAAIAAAKPAQIIMLRPDTGYWAEERAFMAAFVADVLAEDGRRVNTFTIIYRDSHCDALCVQTSYAAAARELATMFRYMLEVDIGYRTNAAPTAWRDKTLVKEFPQWANRCVADTHEDRIVRQYGERLWVNPSAFGSITLVSLSWRGCNVTESL